MGPPVFLGTPRVFRIRAIGGGFTLIELLVVVTVVGILASLLLPALSRSRARADSAGCQSNLRQWGVAMRMHVDEHGSYPQTLWSTNDAERQGVSLFWWSQLSSYIGGPGTDGQIYNSPFFTGTNSQFGVHLCPGLQRLLRLPPGHWAGCYGYNEAGVSYQMDRAGLLGLGGELVARSPLVFRAIKESEVPAPSQSIAMGDAALGWFEFPTAPKGLPREGVAPVPALGPFNLAVARQLGGYSGMQIDLPLRTTIDAINRRHSSRWNTLFCDAHVESRQGAQLFDVRRDAVLRDWNRDNLPHRDLAMPWVP